MKQALSALFIGLLFGAGLALSGMMNPAKVIGFLDFAGAWDPTLAVVMAAALGTTFIGFRVTLRRDGPLLGGVFTVPTRNDLDPPLICGALLFGVGWGLAGFCPGPAISALASGRTEVLVFVAAMVAGMLAHRFAGSVGAAGGSRDIAAG